MQGSYGNRFLNMWKSGTQLPDGQDMGIANAMRSWGEKLGGFAECPDAIADVLRSLPADPPTLPQFAELCRHAMGRHHSDKLALPNYMTPEEKERADKAADAALRAVKKRDTRDHLDWARRPRSKMAMYEVFKAAALGRDERFREIAAKLIEDKCAMSDGTPTHIFNGKDWVAV